ncbi:hypothetical protein ACHAWX_002572 [Stephanocyclus meneghinianus]
MQLPHCHSMIAIGILFVSIIFLCLTASLASLTKFLSVYPHTVFSMRGFLDTGNGNPILHGVGGYLCTYFVACTAKVPCLLQGCFETSRERNLEAFSFLDGGVYATTVFVFFQTDASLAHQEVHHKKFNYNYMQYNMFYDLWMDTFLEHKGPMCTAELERKKVQI